MSAQKSAFSARSHHSTHSHRRPREDDLESNAPPASTASFTAPTVAPTDSVSQIGARHSHGHLSARHSSHPSRRSHSRGNAPWDDGSSGLLTERNLQAHNAESRSRSSSQPPPQVYVEVYEERTATSGYDSYTDTPRQSLHPQDRSARSHHTERSPSRHGGSSSRVEVERWTDSKTLASLHPSRTPKSHASRSSHHSHAHSPASRSSSRTATQISKRDYSSSPTRSSAPRTIISAHPPGGPTSLTSAPSNLSSHESRRVSRYEISPARSQASRNGEVHEILVEYEERNGPFETGQVEVEEADDQVRTRDYKVHYRHQYPVYVES